MRVTCSATAWRCCAASSNQSDASTTLSGDDTSAVVFKHENSLAYNTKATTEQFGEAMLRRRRISHRLLCQGCDSLLHSAVADAFDGVQCGEGICDGCAGVALRSCFSHEGVALLSIE